MDDYGVITLGEYLISIPGVLIHLLLMFALVAAVLVGDSKKFLKVSASIAAIVAVIVVSNYLGMLPFIKW